VTSRDCVFVSAPAKINLFLHVGDRRSDGYHNLESLVAFALHHDDIRLDRDEALSLSVGGPFGAALPISDNNLVLRAARLLAEKTGVCAGVRITLTKTIPVASGLGGGSADAAAVLRGLVQLWDLDIGREALHQIAASLGADVPVCLDSTAAWMEERGERITLLPPLPDIRFLLVNPGVPVSTAQVFAALDRRRGTGLECPRTRFEGADALVRFLRSTANDLEEPACAIAPVVGEVLEEMRRLPEISIARMSGSGATCFGIFDSQGALQSATSRLADRHPDWWIAGTGLAPVQTSAPAFDQQLRSTQNSATAPRASLRAPGGSG